MSLSKKILLSVLLSFLFFACKKKTTTNDTNINVDSIVVKVQSATEIGALSMPPHLAGRDGGQSTLVSGEVKWIFGDSFFDQKGVDGIHYRTNTAAQSTVANPLATTENLDAKGVSTQFIPFTAQEKRFNDSTNKPGDRIALWPTGIVTVKNQALVFYTKLHIASTWTDYGIGIAHYTKGQLTATRNSDLLFHYPESQYQSPFIYNQYLYLYAQLRNKSGTGISRAPLDKAESRDAYEFWNGRIWVKDINAAVVIMDVAPISVSYNPYFKTLITIYNQPFNNTAYIRFANKPEGPWSKKQVLYNTPPPSSNFNYIINEHAELSKNNGKTIVISYSHPLPAFLAGEISLVEITFE